MKNVISIKKQLQEGQEKTLTPEDMKKVKDMVRMGVEYLREIADIRESIKEAVERVSEETGIDKKTLRKAIRYAYEANKKGVSEITALEEEKDLLETIEALLG